MQPGESGHALVRLCPVAAERHPPFTSLTIDTLKPLSRTNSVVEPELAGEVNAGKSHQLAFRWWKT